jgi:hypothetical protein
MRTLVAVAVVALAVGCATSAPTSTKGIEVPSQELVVTQNLTDFNLKLVAKVTGPEGAKVEAATWELVVDGKVVHSGTQAVGVALSGGSAEVSFAVSTKYVSSADELKAMDARGGSLLVALRGKLQVKHGESTLEAPFARSREVRTPRLPHMKMVEMEGGRFADNEASITFHLGVVNPNPFEISVSQIAYEVQVAGKPVEKDVIARGERVNPASTGVFDVEVRADEASHGKDVVKLIKSKVLPYVVTGTLTADLFTEAFDFKGDLKLNESK